MLEFFSNNIAEFFIGAGILLMAIEAGIMGFATLFLFFIGVGALVTGIAMNLEWVATEWKDGIATMAIVSAALGLLLWRPMKTLQSEGDDPKTPRSDFVGLEFELTSELSSRQVSSLKYSGILWTVKAGVPIPETLETGTKVKVTSVEVGTLYVAPLE